MVWEEATMSLYNYFHPVSSLPTSQQSGISERMTVKANKAVKQVLEKLEKKKVGENVETQLLLQ